jgi:signal transduction histidine kinase
VVAVFGSVTRARARVALPTQLHVPVLAAWALALGFLALLAIAVAGGIGTSMLAGAVCLMAGIGLGYVLRRSMEARAAPARNAERAPSEVLGDAFEDAPDGILLATASLRVVAANRVFQRLAAISGPFGGLTAGHVLFLPDAGGVDGDFIEGVREQPIAIDVMRADGVRIPVEMTFARLSDGSYEFIVRDGEARRRAEAELLQSRAQLQRLTRRLSAGIEEERRRIAREVHDELGQQLIRLKHDVAWLQSRTPSAETAERIAALSEVLDETSAIVRRIASELRPSVLDELGLSAAVEWQVLDFGRRTGLATTLSMDEAADALENAAATALFRILQEALTNVAKHAAARRVHVRLLRKNGDVCLEVRDDGRGLRPGDIADPSRLGLLGMKERADAFGGSIQVTALPDAGTTVCVRLPVTNIGVMRIA